MLSELVNDFLVRLFRVMLRVSNTCVSYFQNINSWLFDKKFGMFLPL